MKTIKQPPPREDVITAKDYARDKLPYKKRKISQISRSERDSQFGQFGPNEESILDSPTEWLNDVIINSYFETLQKKFVAQLFANSFLYGTLYKAKESRTKQEKKLYSVRFFFFLARKKGGGIIAT